MVLGFGLRLDRVRIFFEKKTKTKFKTNASKVSQTLPPSDRNGRVT